MKPSLKKGYGYFPLRNMQKWLRYFPDFCSKYSISGPGREPVRLFIEKLWNKKQTTDQQKQAAHNSVGFLKKQYYYFTYK